MRWPRSFGTVLMAATQMIAANAVSFRAITFNIRYAADPGTYERPWAVRGPLAIRKLTDLTDKAITAGAIPIIGLQEVLHEQIVDITTGIGNGWHYIGTGRDDGKESGEYCPIFWKPAHIKLLDSTQKWLSPTPDVPSFWPGAGSRRYVIVGVFEDQFTGTRFIAANTHLDNLSSVARAEGAKIILRVLRDVQAQWGPLPVMLTGDFNSEPGPEHDAYQTMVADGYLGEAYAIADEKQRFGGYDTFTGFIPSELPMVHARIDFLWLGPNATDTWNLTRYEVVNNFVAGIYISDHKPVYVDITLKK